MTAYDDLMAYTRVTEALASVAGRTGWDQETMMPPGAAAQRAEELAALETVLHERRGHARIGEWLEAARADGAVATANLREIRRSYDRTRKMPADLAVALARLTSEAQGIWAEARQSDDVAGFLPTLREIVRLKREEAAALSEGGDLYDALLQDYEPGMTGQGLQSMFDRLRPQLVDLRARVLDAAPIAGLDAEFPEAAQLALSTRLAEVFGYDFGTGRIDKAVHPFSSGSGADVRITTRTNPEDPFNCFYSTIHEVGHAAYEQGISPDYALTPLGSGVSMGVHESQSRIYENQLGRSESFSGWLYHEMTARFGGFGIEDAAQFYAVLNRVTPGYIRTEADELHYNLHVMLRFDLERALISSELEVDDLEAAWNARFAKDFGQEVDRPSNGLLQDVHWAAGLFGYFPTYSLGNVYAGCLHQALRADLPDLDAALAAGDPSPATDWLRDRLQRFGRLRPARETIEHACGFAPDEAPLIAYLEEKYSALYRI